MKRSFCLLRCLSALLPFGMLFCQVHARALEDPIADRISRMSLREKVGQLFMIRPDALEGRFGPDDLENNSITGTTQVTDEMRERYAA